MEVMTVFYIKMVALVILAIGVWFEVNYECNKKRTDLLLGVFFIAFSVFIFVFQVQWKLSKFCKQSEKLS